MSVPALQPEPDTSKDVVLGRESLLHVAEDTGNTEGKIVDARQRCVYPYLLQNSTNISLLIPTSMEYMTISPDSIMIPLCGNTRNIFLNSYDNVRDSLFKNSRSFLLNRAACSC